MAESSRSRMTDSRYSQTARLDGTDCHIERRQQGFPHLTHHSPATTREADRQDKTRAREIRIAIFDSNRVLTAVPHPKRGERDFQHPSKPGPPQSLPGHRFEGPQLQSTCGAISMVAGLHSEFRVDKSNSTGSHGMIQSECRTLGRRMWPLHSPGWRGDTADQYFDRLFRGKREWFGICPVSSLEVRTPRRGSAIPRVRCPVRTSKSACVPNWYTAYRYSKPCKISSGCLVSEAARPPIWWFVP